jgi:hypothetical protein
MSEGTMPENGSEREALAHRARRFVDHPGPFNMPPHQGPHADYVRRLARALEESESELRAQRERVRQMEEALQAARDLSNAFAEFGTEPYPGPAYIADNVQALDDALTRLDASRTALPRQDGEVRGEEGGDE